MTEIRMDQDKSVRINWGNFNMPTIVGIITIAAMVYSQGGKQERVDARLDFIEQSRAANIAANNTRLAAIEAVVMKIPNMDYRITVNEQGLIAVNARIDRVTDTLGSLRDDLAGIKTSIEVLTEQLKSAAGNGTSYRKSELIPVPPAYRQ